MDSFCAIRGRRTGCVLLRDLLNIIYIYHTVTNNRVVSFSFTAANGHARLSPLFGIGQFRQLDDDGLKTTSDGRCIKEPEV